MDDWNSEVTAALQYAATILGALDSITDGALVHDRNKLRGNLLISIERLQAPHKRRDLTDGARLTSVWSDADRAKGWMLRMATADTHT